MARTKTTSDPFNAIAEPKRRELIELLVGKQLTVNEIKETLGWSQPMVSKHLAVLRRVELVSEEKQGRYRVYQVNYTRLKSIQDWVQQFERYWSSQFDQLDNYLQHIQENKNGK